MIPETANPQEAKTVYPGKLEWHDWADQGRYFTQSLQCCFFRGTAQSCTCISNMLIISAEEDLNLSHI